MPGVGVQLIFPNLTAARNFALEHQRLIYCKLTRKPGIYKVFPGGRTEVKPETDTYIRRMLWTCEEVLKHRLKDTVKDTHDDL
jgi:hypothetical protein